MDGLGALRKTILPPLFPPRTQSGAVPHLRGASLREHAAMGAVGLTFP
jgi:hypothetical protein